MPAFVLLNYSTLGPESSLVKIGSCVRLVGGDNMVEILLCRNCWHESRGIRGQLAFYYESITTSPGHGDTKTEPETRSHLATETKDSYDREIITRQVKYSGHPQSNYDIFHNFFL